MCENGLTLSAKKPPNFSQLLLSGMLKTRFLKYYLGSIFFTEDFILLLLIKKFPAIGKLETLRCSRPDVFSKKGVFLEISQNSQENTCARVSFK